MQVQPHEEPPHALGEPAALDRAIARSLDWLARTQDQSGAWLGDYGGPLFLLPMYIGTCFGTGVAIPAETRAEMVRYLRRTQNADGGFGLHVESHSYVFTSAIIYVALRLCEVPADDPGLTRARGFIRDNGSPLAAATWGKFFLALLNLYDYRGLPPVPPELWLLPEALPIHPSRMWCHTRMVYLPMSYLYGRKVQRPADALTHALRTELYEGAAYESIDWEAAKECIAPCDDYTPVRPPMKLVNRLLARYEARASKTLRERALAFTLKQIEAEDLNTQYVCLGPVNKLYHLWVWHHVRPGGPELQKHVEKLSEYLWHGEDGVKMQGYHSSQLWDTAFAVQAVVAAGETTRARDLLVRAHQFIDDNQVRDDLPQRRASYRDPTKGGWGFSAKDNGWIVSDCTAEGVRAALAVAESVPTPLSEARLLDAVGYLLWSQTPSGGWASYEPGRAPAWLELLNPSNVFGDIMIDYPYVECTAASMLALAHFRQAYPGKLDARIERALTRGRAFLLEAQRDDGSFEGSWGICFTYGTWFGIEGLRAGGLAATHPRIVAAADFLERHQLTDGGWGETPESCYRRSYVHAECGQVVMTSWALLGLLAAGRTRSRAVASGLRFLVDAQRDDGSYPPEHIAGIFNKTCAIHYANYLKVFPLWALGTARTLLRGDEASQPSQR